MGQNPKIYIYVNEVASAVAGNADADWFSDSDDAVSTTEEDIDQVGDKIVFEVNYKVAPTAMPQGRAR